MNMVQLKGVTCDSPRGSLPLLAASSTFEADQGVSIDWDLRSPQDLARQPVRHWSDHYDLVVVEHTQIGAAVADACLLPLDEPDGDPASTDGGKGSVGLSHASYRWNDRQWAMPIEAVPLVQAWRPDRMSKPLMSWKDVLSLARARRLALPLRPPQTLLVFYALCASLGRACCVAGPELIDLDVGVHALAMLRELVSLLDPRCFHMDATAVYEAMAASGSSIDCAPMISGLATYSVPGFRRSRIAFAECPGMGPADPPAAPLGGRGIAVSARSRAPRAAMDFAGFVARGDIQRDVYAPAGGQPAHADAWEADRTNRQTANFSRETRAAIERATLLPRHRGAVAFEIEASSALVYALNHDMPVRPIIEALNRRYAASLA